MDDLTKYHDIGKALIERLRLTTYPVAVRLIRNAEREPEAALRPMTEASWG